MSQHRDLLLTPGPVTVAAQVELAAAQPVVYHRGEGYSALLRRLTRSLTQILGADGCDVYVIAASGTGALESALSNLCRPGEQVVVVVNGQFGARLAGHARALGLDVTEVRLPWNTPAGPGDVAPALTDKTAAVVVVHVETSTGVVNDVAAIGGLCARSDATVVADAVSSAGALPVDMAAHGLDVVVTSSQKALGGLPGLAVIAISAKAWRRRDQRGDKLLHYFDWRVMREALEDRVPQSPWTPPVSLVQSLAVAADLIVADGLTETFARLARHGEAIRAGLTAAGFELFAQAQSPVSPVTVAFPPAGVDAGQVIAWLRENARVIIAGGQGQLKGRVIRVAHLGDTGLLEVLGFVACCRAAVAALSGSSPPPP